MKLEVLHPLLKNHIVPATVCKVFNNKYFLVEVDDLREPEERSVVRVSCHGNQIGIFPVTWCQSQGIKLTPPRGRILRGKSEIDGFFFVLLDAHSGFSDTCI